MPFLQRILGEKMGVQYVKGFRMRDYRIELESCRRCKIYPSEFDLLLKRSNELNDSDFSSEVWFQTYLHKIEQNIKVNRNYPILNKFFADFYIKDMSLVIEIDGNSHDETKDYDQRRDQLFIKRGLKVIRIRHRDHSQAVAAIEFIQSKLISRSIKRIQTHKGKRILIRPAGYELKVQVVAEQRKVASEKKIKRKKIITERQARVIAFNQKKKKEHRLWKEAKMNEMMLNALKK